MMCLFSANSSPCAPPISDCFLFSPSYVWRVSNVICNAGILSQSWGFFSHSVVKIQGGRVDLIAVMHTHQWDSEIEWKWLDSYLIHDQYIVNLCHFNVFISWKLGGKLFPFIFQYAYWLLDKVKICYLLNNFWILQKKIRDLAPK